MKRLMHAMLAMTLAVPAPATAEVSADDIDFGDDSGDFSDDGQCDDSRFAGPGMAEELLYDWYDLSDATDCRAAFEAGTIELIEAEDTQDGGNAATPDLRAFPADLDFGDDAGKTANNGQCNDKRFDSRTGAAMDYASVRHDSTDCKAAWQHRQIELHVYFV